MATRVFTKLRRSHFEERRADDDIALDAIERTVPFPKNAIVEVTNTCNHTCVFCTNPRMRRTKRILDTATYTRFLREARRLGLREVGLYGTGEPFTVKNLRSYVEIAAEMGIEYIYITTNGALATPDRAREVIDAGLSSIKFSINAGTPDSYRLIHGRDDFEKVLDNLQAISSYRDAHRPDMRLLASCVITRYTEKEINSLKDHLLEYVDEIIIGGAHNQAGQSLEVVRALDSRWSEQPPPAGKKAAPCPMLWNRIHLTAEGYLTLCCVDYENSLTYADFNSHLLQSAWNNPTITEMRQRHLTQQLAGTLCHNCLYHEARDRYPISPVGHADRYVALDSNAPGGIRSIEQRLSELQEHAGSRFLVTTDA